MTTTAEVRHRALALAGIAVRPVPDDDEAVRALLCALDEFRDFNPALHPRNPKGSKGGGRFRSTVDKLIDALKAWSDSGGKGDPFKDFEREPLRKAAKARGITLKRGATRDDIVEALKADLSKGKGSDGDKGDDKAEAKAPAKKTAPAKKAVPNPGDFGNFPPSPDASWDREEARRTLFFRHDPVARDPDNIQAGQIVPILGDNANWARVTDVNEKKNSIRLAEPGKYTREDYLTAIRERVRKNAAERAWREAGGTEAAWRAQQADAAPAPVKAAPVKKTAPAKPDAPAPAARVPTYTPPSDLDKDAVGKLRAALHMDATDAHTLHEAAHKVNLADPDSDLGELVQRLGPVEAHRIAREMDVKHGFDRFIQVNHRPEDPDADPYADLAPVTPAERTQAQAEAAAALAEDLANRPIAVRVKESSLSAILDSGGFRNVEDTGQSGSLGGKTSAYRTRRKRAEAMLFGIAENAPGSDRPIYGYVPAGIEKPEEHGFLAQYGDIQVVLKPAMRDRTTVTVGDSIDMDALPSPIDAPTWESFNGAAHMTSGLHLDPTSIYDVEAQIHGGVSLADIDEVAFNGPVPAALAKRLDALGIPHRDVNAPDPQQAARDRQAAIDHARKYAAAAGELDEILANGGSDKAVLSRLRAAAQRDGTDLDGVIAAVEAGDRDKARAEMAALLQREGVTPYDKAGDRATFNPATHEAIGGKVRPGAPVLIVRPGHYFIRDGEGVQLGKSIVEEADAPAPAAPSVPPHIQDALDAADGKLRPSALPLTMVYSGVSRESYEEHFTPDQRRKILDRLREILPGLAPDAGDRPGVERVIADLELIEWETANPAAAVAKLRAEADRVQKIIDAPRPKNMNPYQARNYKNDQYERRKFVDKLRARIARLEAMAAAPATPGARHRTLALAGVAVRAIPSDELDEDCRAFMWALDEWRAWDPKKHPRGPGGRFLTTADIFAKALRRFSKYGDMKEFDQFDREQLRKVAKARGVTIPRGADRGSILAAILARAINPNITPAPAKATPAPAKKASLPNQATPPAVGTLVATIQTVHGPANLYTAHTWPGGQLNFSVKHHGTDVGHMVQSGADWVAWPPTNAKYGLQPQGSAGSGYTFPDRDAAARGLVQAYVQYQKLTAPPPPPPPAPAPAPAAVAPGGAGSVTKAARDVIYGVDPKARTAARQLTAYGALRRAQFDDLDPAERSTLLGDLSFVATTSTGPNKAKAQKLIDRFTPPGTPSGTVPAQAINLPAGVVAKQTRVTDPHGIAGALKPLDAARRGRSGDGWLRLPNGGTGPWGQYGAAGVLLRHVGSDGTERYLMVQRGPAISDPGKWQFPGGAIDEKESPHQGAGRETIEELGFKAADLDGARVHGDFTASLPGTSWAYTSIAATVDTQLKPDLSSHHARQETSDAKWMTRSEIDALDQKGKMLKPLAGGQLQTNVMSLFPAASGGTARPGPTTKRPPRLTGLPSVPPTPKLTHKPSRGVNLMTDKKATNKLRQDIKKGRAAYAGKVADDRLAVIGAMQGFDDMPTVVTKQEMNRLLKTGNYVEAWRGVRGAGGYYSGPTRGGAVTRTKTAAEVNEDFRSGIAYYGNGIYGNGYYFATKKSFASGYADGTPGSLMRVLIPNSAKIEEHSTIKSEAQSKHAPYTQATGVTSGEKGTLYDEGRYAAAKGIDVLRISYNYSNSHVTAPGKPAFNVLNRSVLIVEEG